MLGSRRQVAAAGFLVAVFLVIQLGALAVVRPFENAGYRPVDDPGNPLNSLLYLVAILVVTGVLLAALWIGLERILRASLVFAGAYVSLFVFQVLLPDFGLPSPLGFHSLAWVVAAGLAIALWVHPEWYVIDTAGVLMGVGAAGLFGITFGIFPALLLLAVLAVYDAISVYGTEHMLTLASGVLDLRVPIVLVVPLSLTYSFREADPPDPAGTADDPDSTEGSDPLERDALFIGLGDAIVPAVLVASAGVFLPVSPVIRGMGIALTLPVIGAILGTIAGLLVLLRMVFAGRAHAGLPLLNGGAIAGYLIGAVTSGLTLSQALGIGALV
ncbi:MAG: presenilin family intramembrane aspartyl protease PSH [Salinirussus sp.]